MQRALVSILAFAFAGCAAQPTQSRVLVAQATPAPASAPPAASSEPPRDESNARAFGWIAIGFGASASAVAIATSFMMLHQKGVRDDECSSRKLCTQRGLDANDQLSSLGGWNAGAYTIAAVGLGVGAFLVLTHPVDEKKEVSAGVGPNGITLRGTF